MCNWGVEVEILQTDGAVACTLCEDDTVEMNFDCDHVNSGGTTIPKIGDGIATNNEAGAIGIGLLRMIVDAHASVRYIFALVNKDVVLSDEDDCVGAFANAGDTQGKVTSLIV